MIAVSLLSVEISLQQLIQLTLLHQDYQCDQRMTLAHLTPGWPKMNQVTFEKNMIDWDKLYHLL